METKDALDALSALAHGNRLAVFRLLVQAGPEGLPAGEIASALGIAPSSLSFHLKELSQSALVDVRQDGRFLIYSARYSTMNLLIAYLTENCCRGQPCASPPDAATALDPSCVSPAAETSAACLPTACAPAARIDPTSGGKP